MPGFSHSASKDGNARVGAGGGNIHTPQSLPGRVHRDDIHGEFPAHSVSKSLTVLRRRTEHLDLFQGPNRGDREGISSRHCSRSQNPQDLRVSSRQVLASQARRCSYTEALNVTVFEDCQEFAGSGINQKDQAAILSRRNVKPLFSDSASVFLPDQDVGFEAKGQDRGITQRPQQGSPAVIIPNRAGGGPQVGAGLKNGSSLGILPERALHGCDALGHCESLFRNLVVNQ